MKTRKNIILIAILAIIAAACTPMDDKYKEFVEDGPITYIAKVNEEDVTVVGERNKVHFSWPKYNDPRWRKAVIYWSNRTESYEQTLNPDAETSFYINNLDEGSYIFEIVIFDELGNKSISTTVTGEVYGDNYEQYLMNRAIIASNLVENDKLELTFAKVIDATMRRTHVSWNQEGQLMIMNVDTSMTVVTLDNFKARSFQYSTVYVPGTDDEFESPSSYSLITPSADDIEYSSATKKFVFPDLSADDNWVGYELTWTDRFTFERKSTTITGNTATLSDYQAAEFSFSALFNYDDRIVSSASAVRTTSTRQDIDRSIWYVAPETDKETGEPIANVNHKSSVSDKNKSPYLSHLLPWNNTAVTAIDQSNQDGVNAANAHIDDNPYTYLSMVKGKGTGIDDDEGNSSGSDHSNGGVVSDGKEVYFVIDLGAETEFDYFRIHYRISGGNANLKPKKATLYGSNDPGCITDRNKFELIMSGIDLPECDSAPSATSGNNTGNVAIPLSNYKYLKVRYDAWSSTSNTMQITDFYLGGTAY